MNYSYPNSPFIGLTFYSNQRLIISTNYPKEIIGERDKLLLTKLSKVGIQIQNYIQFAEVANERITKVLNGEYIHVFLDYYTDPIYICSWRDERVKKGNRIFDKYTQGYWPELIGYRSYN